MKAKMRYDYVTVRSEFTPRCPLKRKVMHNTYLHRESEADNEPIKLRYHATDIIEWRSSGLIIVDTDGWHTPTTKLRLNEYLSPFRIYQDRGQWFWCLPQSGWDKRVPFTDRDQITPVMPDEVRLVTAVGPDEAENAMRERRKLQAKVMKYANLYAEHMPFDWESRKGDCLKCQWYLARNQQRDGKLVPAPILTKHIGTQVVERTPTCGEIESGAPRESVADHLMSHIEEGYVMASLCYNALTHPNIPCAPAWMWVAFKGPDGQTFPDRDGWLKKRVCKAIAKYLRLQLGLVR